MSRIIMLDNGNEYEQTAWTGGDTPDKTAKENEDFRKLRRFFFRKQLKDCGGLDLWKFTEHLGLRTLEDKIHFKTHGWYGTGCMERARIFWNRASYDAWRTLQFPL
ncbi:MAG TPA: hypothetical protein PLP33_24700 [Leptospiraceae bacterium]|nr:hypothetical protein [Leptospiraceae bacterium]